MAAVAVAAAAAAAAVSSSSPHYTNTQAPYTYTFVFYVAVWLHSYRTTVSPPVHKRQTGGADVCIWWRMPSPPYATHTHTHMNKSFSMVHQMHQLQHRVSMLFG